MNLLIISTAELVAVNSIAVQYVRRTDSVSLISCISGGRTAFSNFGSFNSVRRTDDSNFCDQSFSSPNWP